KQEERGGGPGPPGRFGWRRRGAGRGAARAKRPKTRPARVVLLSCAPGPAPMLGESAPLGKDRSIRQQWTARRPPSSLFDARRFAAPPALGRAPCSEIRPSAAMYAFMPLKTDGHNAEP